MATYLKTGHRQRGGAGLTTHRLGDLERAIVASRRQFAEWYVDSNKAGGVAGTGTSWEDALLTLAAAILVAKAGDTIYLAEAHAETLTASVALNKAGIKIIGFGRGTRRPTFTYGAAAATITVTGAGCHVENLHCIANFLSVAAAFTLGATSQDFNLVGCSFVDNSSILDFLSIVVTGSTANAADGLTVVDCYWLGLAVSPNAFISILGALNRLNVIGNHCDMAATNDVGHFITIAALVILGAQIIGNRLNVVGSAGAAVGIFMTGSSTTNTGMLAYNLVTSLDTTAALLVTAAINLGVHENYLSGAVASSGAVWPVADNPA